MAIPSDLPVQQALDQIDALVVQVGDLTRRLSELSDRLTTLECVRRIDRHLAVLDSMADDGIGPA